MTINTKDHILNLLKNGWKIEEIAISFNKSRSYVHRIIKHDIDYIKLYKNRKHTDQQVHQIIRDYKSINPKNREIKGIADVIRKNNISMAFLYQILNKYNIKRRYNLKNKI